MGYKIKGGKVERETKLPPEAARAAARQHEAFIKKFGREPGPDDPLFFDPDSATPKQIAPERMRSEMLDAMQKAGTPQHLVYAYEKTGLIVNEHGYKNLSPEDRAAYDAALEEYWANEERETGP